MPAVEFTRVSIAADADDALNEALRQIPEDSSGPIMLVGLEQAVPSDRERHPILENLNLSRPQWPQSLVRPVVFWIPDYLLGLMGRFAPDFLDWRSDTVHLPTLDETGIAEFERMTTSAGTDDSLPLELRMDRIKELRSRLKSHSASSDPVVLSATVGWWAELANHVRTLARFDEALEYYKKALEIAEELLGKNHPTTATCVNNLGIMLKDLGDLDGARACFERTLKIHESAYGVYHPDIATCLNNLGSVLQDQGDLDRARECYERSLRIDESAYGPDHPSVARDANNLGLVLKDQGNLDLARECYERVLKIAESTYEPGHPKVATYVNNLGLVLQAQGDLAEARACFERALKIGESAYGPNHPDVASCVNNLGFLLFAQGDIRGALEYFERALQVRESGLGPHHPDTKASRQAVELIKTRL